MYIGHNRVVITTEPIPFDFDLPNDFGINLKHEIYSIKKHNERLSEHAIKKEIRHYCPNIRMEKIFMNKENSITNEKHKFVFNLSQRLNFKSSNKYVALQNLSIHYNSAKAIKLE